MCRSDAGKIIQELLQAVPQLDRVDNAEDFGILTSLAAQLYAYPSMPSLTLHVTPARFRTNSAPDLDACMAIVAAEPQLSQNDLNVRAEAAGGDSAAHAEDDAKAIFAFTQRLLRRRLMM